MSTSQLVRAIYDYDADANDGKVLSCTTGELFIVIKATKPAMDWLYVVNSGGRLGYIPSNFTTPDELTDAKYLEFIDTVISLLEKKPNSDLITVRQINHAQVKLTQLRCEIVQRIYGATGPSPEIVFVPPNGGGDSGLPDPRIRSPSAPDIMLPNPIEQVKDGPSPKDLKKKRVSFQEEVEEVPAISYDDETTQTEMPTVLEVAEPARRPSISCDELAMLNTVPDTLVPDLIERLRIATDLSHDKCKLVIEVVVSGLGENITGWARKCNQIKERLLTLDASLATPDTFLQSSDSINLKELFRRLWHTKNDEQQRSWPVHEDEHIIQSTLEELIKILTDANPIVTRDILSSQSYDNVHNLVTYLQMETRRSLRLELYNVLCQVIKLCGHAIVNDFLLSSVLPATLAEELINHKQDLERWNAAALLFTLVFSTGNKPPLSLSEHITEDFVNQILAIIEGEDFETGNKLDCDVPAVETSIPVLLSFNLQFDARDSNIVLRALSKRSNASQLTENLVSALNWEEDPTVPQKVFNDEKLLQERPNAVHKLLNEIFESKDTAKLVYFNDIRVVMDILVTHLNNADKNRLIYLKMCHNIILNTDYNDDDRHKELTSQHQQIFKCLDAIESHESSESDEKNLSMDIRSLLTKPSTN